MAKTTRKKPASSKVKGRKLIVDLPPDEEKIKAIKAGLEKAGVNLRTGRLGAAWRYD